MNGIYANLNPVMREHVRKRANHRTLKQLNSNQQGAYSLNKHFKLRTNKYLEIFTRDHNPQEKVEFLCRTIDASVLPKLEQESMNSFGSTKLLNLIDYIFYNDELYKHVPGCPSHS